MEPTDILIEYWAHFHAENPNAVQDEDAEFDREAILRAMERGDDWEAIA